MEKDFTDESQARIFRDKKREEGFAASLFTYGKDRYRVKVWKKWETHPEDTQWRLSDSANKLSEDIKGLNKIKELIANPDFGCDVEDAVFVAKHLDRYNWFKYPKDVINFFDSPSEKELAKIKDMVDTALSEYEEEWNDKSHQGVTT